MNYITKLQTRLEENANPKTKTCWEQYLKHVIPFRGVKMAYMGRCQETKGKRKNVTGQRYQKGT
jgi:hypothetical protein